MTPSLQLEDPFLTHGKEKKMEHLATDPFMTAGLA